MFYDRVMQKSSASVQISKPHIFQAPSQGWIRNQSLARPKPGGAEIMDNWFPTPEGCRMRKGSIKRATIDAACTHLTSYTYGAVEKLFAADIDSIYDVTSPAYVDVAPSADVTSLTSGDWSSLQFTTSGGSFLIMVNGADDMRQYTGSSWRTVNSGTTPSITGVNTNKLSQVWRYSSRLWFVGEGFSAWYLDALSIAGAATEFPLTGVFSQGGSLLFGASFSHDAGAGIDDYCVFVTTEGEVAIYLGDPASTMTKVGVYNIGKPLHKNAHFRAGGDVGVLTDDGINSIKLSITKDRAGALGNAISYPIEDAWRIAIQERNSGLSYFTCAIWASKTLLAIGIPSSGSQSKISYVANTKTGAWCRYVGWDIRAIHIFNDRLYFGTRDGFIIEGETSGADQGAPYSAIVIPKFLDLGDAGEKAALQARVIARANNAFTPQLFANADYETDIPTPLSADSDEDTNTWDSGTWGTSTWGSALDTKAKQSEWQGVVAVGQALAPGLQVTSGRSTAPDVELVSLHLVYESGGLMG